MSFFLTDLSIPRLRYLVKHLPVDNYTNYKNRLSPPYLFDNSIVSMVRYMQNANCVLYQILHEWNWKQLLYNGKIYEFC